MERISNALEKVKTQSRANIHVQGKECTEAGALGDRTGPFDLSAEMLTLQPEVLMAHRIVAWDKGNPCTHAFDRLRTKVLIEMNRRGWRTLAVTSPTHGCGTTTVAINLSLSIAHQMFPEVLLVDFNLRNPRIADYLAIYPRANLSDYLEGRDPITTCLADAGGVRLRVLPTLRRHQNATELLSTSQAELLISRVKSDTTPRITIFDLPPLLTVDDAQVVIPQVDCVLLVLAENLTTKYEVKAALRILAGSELLTAVLNRSNANELFYFR